MDNSNDENYWSCDSSSSNQHGRYSNHQQQQYNNPLSSSSSSSYVTATECGHCPACCRSPSSTSSNTTTDADDNNYDQDENQSSSGQCCYLATSTDITSDNDDQSKDWLELQVLEMSPEMTKMGDSFLTSSELLAAHQDVLLKLQSKQSPVEELLKQADQLIASQRPRAEVYAAMAESLGQAWKDLNSFLEQRRVILEFNVSFHSHGEDVIEKLVALDRESQSGGAVLPSDVESVKRLRTRLEEARKSTLESFRLALLDGEVLIEKLTAMKETGTLDSRPAQILPAINAALNQVRGWLEALHDRRRRSEAAYQSRRTLLDQWADVCALRKELGIAEKQLDNLNRHHENSALGDSSATAEMLLFDHNKLLPEFRELQEKSLKLTHRAEELQDRWKKDVCPGEALDGVRREAYNLLDKVSEYVDTVEGRGALLEQSIHFFRVAAAALTKLDQLEVQLTAHQAAPGSPQLAQLHAQVSRALEDATAPALHHGYSLLDNIGRSHPGAEGIRRTVEVIENRGIQLGSLCTAHKEESMRIAQSARSFIEQCELAYSWLMEVVEMFLRSQTDMKGTLPEAREVLDRHTQVLNDLNMKGSEIEALLMNVNPLCEMAEEAQAHEVQMKSDLLHDAWQKLRRAVGDRVELMQTYVRLHALAMQVQEAWDEVEAKCKDSPEDASSAIRQAEEAWLNGQQKYLQLNQMGRNFMADALHISDRYLDVRKACLCVESLLEYLGGRQLNIHQIQQSWIETITTISQTRQEWTQFVTIIQSVMAVQKEKEGSLYPMLPSSDKISNKLLPSCSRMIDLIEEKSDRIVAEVTATIQQLDTRKAEAESIQLSGENHEEKIRMVSEIHLVQQRMQFRLKEYKTLIQMAEVLFKNLSEVEAMVDILDEKERKQIGSKIYQSTAEVDAAIKDHQVTYQTVNELIKITRQEANQLISLLRSQEPAGATQQDIEIIEAYLKRAEVEWERSWKAEEVRLGRQMQRCQFNADLHAIHVQLDELSRQLAAMSQGITGQYGSSLAAVKVTSEAFLQFEKTIQLLEVRIGTFFSSARQMIDDENQKVHQPDLESELGQIDSKWSNFHKEVDQTRNRIDLSLEYFDLVEQVEQSFRQGGQLLVTLARKSTQVKNPEEAQSLMREVDDFIKPQEVKMDEKMRKISKLAIQLYGIESPEHIQNVVKENKNMMESFAVINTELSTLAINLKAIEEDRLKQAQTQAAVQESLEAARAEAAAARAAASAADEARRAAEAAAKAMKEDWNLAQQLAPPRPPLPAEVTEIPRPSYVTGRTAPEPPKRTKESYVIDGPVFTQLLKDVYVEESKAVQFTCSVTGKPMPTITWLKDGVDIINNPDYQTDCVVEDADSTMLTCSLTIEETFADDSGRFTCQASNPAGFAQSTATLNVQEFAEEGVLTAPEFVQVLEESVAREGQPHRLSCRLTGHPQPVISWFKNGVCVDHCRDYVISEDGNEEICCQLSFAQVFVEDGAVFECRARNEAGEAATSAKLTVEPLEPTERPVFNPGLSSNVMARTGQRVRLECVLTAGLPKPTVHWLHNNKPLKETRDVKTLVEGGNTFLLTITEAFSKDAGTYTAVARNAVGEATTTCNLAVKGRVPTETSDSELASDMEPIQPSIQQALPAVKAAREGDKIRLDCVIVAQPEPEVIWYHNDRPVKESSDFQLMFQGDRCSLVIREAFQEDSGTYRVVAVNSAGEASSQCQLNISPIEEISTALVSVPESGDPPTFTQIFSNADVVEGGRLVFECTIAGRPVPDVKWFFDEELIGPAGSGRVGETDNYRLNLENVKPAQAGRYKCVAESPSGVATCLAHLTVLPASSKKSKELMMTATSVSFEKEVMSSSFKSVTEVKESMSTLVKEEMKVEEEEAAKVSVKERASLFGGSATSTTESIKVKKTVGGPKERKAVAPRFVSSLTGAMVETGANVQLEAILDGHPVPEVKWYKNGVEIFRNSEDDSGTAQFQMNDRLEMSFGGQKARLSIRNVEESDAGRYTCTARSPAGTASCTADVVVRRTQFPPVFGRRLQAQTVRPGSRVTMEVEVTGTPAPEVSWFKDDVHPLPESIKATMKMEGNRHKIVIAKVTESDAGRYTVRAVNRAGEAVSTAELYVSSGAVTPTPESMESSAINPADLIRKHPNLKVDVGLAKSSGGLQPEPPPEVLYAPKTPEVIASPVKTPVGSSSSSVAIRRKSIDVAGKARMLEEASRMMSPTEIPGGIRLLPLPTPEVSTPSSANIKFVAQQPATTPQPIMPTVELSKFEPFPELEPFPFLPDPPVEKKEKQPVPAIRKPAKFIRGESRESDYESDLDSTRIRPRWTPAGSESEESTSFKRVKVQLDKSDNAKPMTKEPTPPSQFEIPLPVMDGPPRPTVLSEEAVKALLQAKLETNKERIPSPHFRQPELSRVSCSSPSNRKPSQKALEMEKQWSHRFQTASGNSKIWPPTHPALPEEHPHSPSPIWVGQVSETSHKSVSKTQSESTKIKISESGSLPAEATTRQVTEKQQHHQNSFIKKEEIRKIPEVKPKMSETGTIPAELKQPKVPEFQPKTHTPELKPKTPEFHQPSRPTQHFSIPEAKPKIAETGTKTQIPEVKPKTPQFHQPSRPTQHFPIPEVKPKIPETGSRFTGMEQTQRMQMEESTNFSKRFVTLEQTSRVVQYRPDQNSPLEPFPFVPDPPTLKSPSGTLLKRPTKFIPVGNFMESDYESDYDGAKIRPRWTPAGSESEEPKYRVVQPPSNSGSLNRKDYKRKTPTPPTVFDQVPPSFEGPPRPVISPSDAVKLKKCAVEAPTEFVIVKPKAIRPVAPLKPAPKYPQMPMPQPVMAYAGPPPAVIAQEKAASHFNQMSSAFKAQAQQLAHQVISDVKYKQEQPLPTPPKIQQLDENNQPALVKPTSTSDPHAYHQENRQAEFGTKHIDPDTGLIYFKYDFGYEFGLVLPGAPQRVDKIESSIGQPGSVELPVLHERTGLTPSPQPTAPSTSATAATNNNSSKSPIPDFRLKKFTTPFKPLSKWEPDCYSSSDDPGAAGPVAFTKPGER